MGLIRQHEKRLLANIPLRDAMRILTSRGGRELGDLVHGWQARSGVLRVLHVVGHN